MEDKIKLLEIQLLLLEESNKKKLERINSYKLQEKAVKGFAINDELKVKANSLRATRVKKQAYIDNALVVFKKHNIKF